MENLQEIENYLRKGEYPPTRTAKQRRQTLEENAGRTLSLKMVASITRSTPKLLMQLTGGYVCAAMRRNQESSKIAMHARRFLLSQARRPLCSQARRPLLTSQMLPPLASETPPSLTLTLSLPFVKVWNRSVFRSIN